MADDTIEKLLREILAAQVAELKRQPDLLRFCNHMIRAVGLEPTDQLRMLAILASQVMAHGEDVGRILAARQPNG